MRTPFQRRLVVYGVGVALSIAAMWVTVVEVLRSHEPLVWSRLSLAACVIMMLWMPLGLRWALAAPGTGLRIVDVPTKWRSRVIGSGWGLVMAAFWIWRDLSTGVTKTAHDLVWSAGSLVVWWVFAGLVFFGPAMGMMARAVSRFSSEHRAR